MSNTAIEVLLIPLTKIPTLTWLPYFHQVNTLLCCMIWRLVEPAGADESPRPPGNNAFEPWLLALLFRANGSHRDSEMIEI